VFDFLEGLELCLGGLSPPKPPAATGLVKGWDSWASSSFKDARSNSRELNLNVYVRGEEPGAHVNIWYGPHQTLRYPSYCRVQQRVKTKLHGKQVLR